MPYRQVLDTTDGRPHLTIPLPIELVVEILEYTLVERHYVRALALVSKLTTELYHKLVYRTIILRTPRTIELFERTATDARQGFIHERVKRVIIIHLGSAPDELCHAAWRIVCLCTGAHTVAFPHPFVPYFLKCLHSDPGKRITRYTHFTFEKFSDMDCTQLATPLPIASPRHPWPSFFAHLTHLRIGDPHLWFVAPRAILAHLGPLPRLTHLYVPRWLYASLAHGPDDAAFVDDVRALLAARPALAHLVVGACLALCKSRSRRCACPRDPEAEEQLRRAAPVWRAIKALQETEARLLIVRGDVEGAWCREWDAGDHAANAAAPFDFWADVVREGLRERERERGAAGGGEAFREIAVAVNAP